MTQVRPSDAQLVAQYDELYTSNLTRWDDTAKNLYMLNAMALFYSATGRSAPERVLDIGCGAGQSLALLARRYPETNCYGIDLSQVAIDVARARLPQGHFLAEPLESARFDVKFDLITFMGVLEHFPQPAEALGHAVALLEPGGVLYVEVPNSISYPESEKVEGYRQLNTGSHQWEWHLFRSSWDRLIQESGLYATATLTGPWPWVEFIWILEPKPHKIGRPAQFRFWWFEQSKRMAADKLVLKGKVKIVRMMRRMFGDEMYERMRGVLR